MSTHILDNPRIAVISDLHVGDPQNPALEDFDSDEAFDHLLANEIPERLGWPATLVIAGDFIDFPQVLPELARHPYGDRYGTTEAESLQRFVRVRDGHPKVFAALGQFIRRGGQVCLLPGNHDPDYHWPAVEAELRAAIGRPSAPAFVFVASGAIHEQGLYIEHGNQYAFDNRFDEWARPILASPDGPRLERPWGTLFMDLVYNDAEAMYPFLNRIYPHGALAAIIARSCADGQVSLKLLARLVAFMLRRGKRFAWERLLGDGEAPAARDTDGLLRSLAPQLGDTDRAKLAALVAVEMRGEKALAGPLPGLLGRDDDHGMTRRATELLLSGAATIVVFGHTHVLVDDHAPFGAGDPRRVFNTGSWMPRVVVDGLTRPSFTDVAGLNITGHELRFLAIEIGDPPRARLESVAP